MAVPVRMNPIWDMEEQARVRFRFTENSASTAPRAMVTSPRVSTRTPKKRSAGRSHSAVIRIP